MIPIKNEMQVFLMSALMVPLTIIDKMGKEDVCIAHFDLPPSLIKEVKANAKKIAEADWQSKCATLTHTIRSCEFMSGVFDAMAEGLTAELEALASSAEGDGVTH